MVELFVELVKRRVDLRVKHLVEPVKHFLRIRREIVKLRVD